MGWGARPRLWLSRPAKPLETSTSQSGVEAIGFTTCKGNQRPGAAACSRTIATTPLWEQEKMTKATTHRIVGELPPCQQCCHGRHCSTTSCHALVWGARSQWQPCLDVWWHQDKTRSLAGQVYYLLPPSASWPLGSREPLSLYVTWSLNSI
jgi:hypothetical protein